MHIIHAYYITETITETYLQNILRFTKIHPLSGQNTSFNLLFGVLRCANLTKPTYLAQAGQGFNIYIYIYTYIYMKTMKELHLILLFLLKLSCELFS